MKILILTEGLEGTGYGHITRCCAIADAFKEKGFSPKLIINGDENVRQILGKYDYIILNWLLEKDKLNNIIENSDVILIDSYKASYYDYESISKFAKVCSFLDDNIRTDYPDGVIINGTVGSENFNYPESDKKKYLLGSLYIPLRKEFWDISNVKTSSTIKNIMITMGGQDIRNLTPKIIKELNVSFPSCAKHVIIGNGFTNTSEIEAGKNEHTCLYYAPNAEKMRNIMMNSDLAISAAGQTIYELARMGIPTFAIGVAENQRNNIYEWQKVGFIRYYSWWDAENLLGKMSESIREIEPVSVRLEISNIGRNKVDGNGSRRIIMELKEDYIEKEGFYLRQASPEDCKVIYDLSNDELVRNNSINTAKILWEDHCGWFSKKLNDPAYVIYVLYDKLSFIGQVKFEIENNAAVIGISIQKEFRGKGIASKILTKACQKLFGERKEIEKIFAYIKPENLPSVKSFCNAGFEFLQKEEVQNGMFLLYELKRKANEVI